MLTNLKKRENFSNAEFYFSQRILELLNFKTIYGYKAQLNNPKTALTEFSQVLMDWHRGKIKDFATVTSLKDEIQVLLENEHRRKKSIESKIASDILSDRWKF